MKLNNRGWGLKEMLVLSAILIFFFCLAIYFIYVFYNSLSSSFLVNNETSTDYTAYKNYEDQLYYAGQNFLLSKENYQDSVINLSALINAGYTTEIIDPATNNECNGYVKISDFDTKEMQAFIKCDSYTTEGY